MSELVKYRKCVMTRVTWLIEQPTKNVAAGLTAYREEFGIDDLFSIYVRFSHASATTGNWEQAKIFALVVEMEPRLPPIGGRLIITAGLQPIAQADVIDEAVEAI